MNVFICDADTKNVTILKHYLCTLSKKYKVELKLFISPKFDQTVLEKISLIRFDLIVIDIDSDQKNVIDFLKKIQDRNKLSCFIFVTDFPEKLWRSLECIAFGYLTKPIEASRFDNLFRKSLIQLTGIRAIQQQAANRMFQFVSERTKFVLKEEQVIFLRREGTGVVITTIDTGEHMVYDTLKNLEGRLSEAFITISRGTIVNRKHIKKIAGKYVVLTNHIKLPISVRNYKNTIEKLTDSYESVIDEQLALSNL